MSGPAESSAIYVRPKGRGFVVTIEPPDDGDRPSELFPDKRRAWGWACGQRLLRRLPIIDATEGRG
jgi:hypothetical protein